ncbi:MAG: hypothetical protein HGA67_03315 [Candidatus Yonathbacteria bacterium]|nr:hypothetical protein [Candidatus Yonathbacteria bacterium]
MSKSIWYAWIFGLVALIILVLAIFIIATKYNDAQKTFGVNEVREEIPASSGATNQPSTKSVKLSIGKSLIFNTLELTLNGVSQDNRCPIDVVCMQAGGVTLSVTLVVGSHKEDFVLSPDKMPKTFDGYRIFVSNVNPPKLSSNTIDPKEYRVTFRIEQLQ